MTGPYGVLCLIAMATLFFGSCNATDSSYGIPENHRFSGVSMSFEFVEAKYDDDIYKVRVTLITGWVLGKGPCGPGCGPGDVGAPTHDRRLQIIANTHDPVIFGNWSTERKRSGRSHSAEYQDITDNVTHNIQGRVASVSTRLNFEQEIAHFDLDIDKGYSYMDVHCDGYGWRDISLNIVPQSALHGRSHAFEYTMQVKIKPGRRSDTGMPNNSPMALYRPMYRLKLNEVTNISLTPSDKDGDLVRCRKAENAERERLDCVPNVEVLPNCVVVISAFEQDGFNDSTWGAVAVTLEDYTRRDMEQEGKPVSAFAPTPLSASVVEFMVQALENITVPEFVDPTPASQHVYTVYAGSQLFIPLYARPSPDSPTDIVVTEFQLLSLPDHQMSAQPPVSVTSRAEDRVVKSALEWRTKDSDAGDYLIQAVAIDSDEFESQDRDFKIHVNPLRLKVKEHHDGAEPYFPFFPEPGSVSCPQNSTCSVPIFAAPGLRQNKIVSIEVVNQYTNITGVESTSIEKVTYRGHDVYRTDIRFTSDMIGDFSVCLKATDDSGLVGEECTIVQLTPPNPCDDMPCQNLGTCVRNGLSDYVCHCKPQYTGQHCETPYDQCSSHPCKNNPTDCTDLGVIGVACTCSDGWTGDLCEIDVVDCQPDSCKNGGACVDEHVGFHCECLAGYGGDDCSQVPTGCATHSCENSGICAEENGQPVCRCPLGYVDAHCHTRKEDTPITKPDNTLTPHAIVPSARPGMKISCEVGASCEIPIYLQGTPGSPPTLIPGITSPGITTSLTAPQTDRVTGFTNTVSSKLTVTPQEPGNHTVCVEIKDNGGNHADDICYTVVSQEPKGESSPPPAGFRKFSSGTPPDGSEITCLRGQPCHMIAFGGSSRVSHKCYPVRSLTPNANVFEARQDGSSTCGTDILLAPQNSTEKVCISAGTTGHVGEERCYTVHTIDSDPCDPSPCHHGGHCMPDGETDYTCICPVPYTGQQCDTLDNCQSERCRYHGVCIDTGASGFECKCQPGFSGDDCRKAPAECMTKDCQNGAICVEEDGHAVCKCPMGKEGDTCMDTDKDVPLRPKPDDELNKPHAVVPSPGNGLEITCDVGKTCQIPVFLKGEISTPPRLTTGPTSPEVTAHVAPIPREAATPPDTLTSRLRMTPTEPGIHHVCVEIHDPEHPNDVDDNICYSIVSTAGTTTTPAPGIDNGQFKNTPEAGSKVHCRTDTPCHIVAQTERPSNGECTPVRSQSIGVYAFGTTEVDATTCSTDILLDPKHITSGQACMKIGFHGEERCYRVDSIDENADPCGANPCVHGLCIPTGPTAHTCACPVPYKGDDCSQIDTCQSERCLNQAGCEDKADGTGFQCHCQPGYEGDDCRHIPELCDTLHCRNGTICVIENGHAVCKCDRVPTGCATHSCENSGICVEENGQPVCRCPLGYVDAHCHTRNEDIPITKPDNTLTPHVIVPSARPCMKISCEVGTSCQIPIFLQGTPGSPPTLIPGITSPGVTTSLTPPQTDKVTGFSFTNTVSSKLTVTPQEPGNHTVCVEIEDNRGNHADDICYTVVSQEPNDACASSPCRYGGTCFSHGATFRCLCPARYTGDLCENWPDPCESSPCHNGGLCFNNADVPHEFICTCPAGYTGQNCSVSLTELVGR